MKKFFKYLLYIHLFVLVKILLYVKKPKIILVLWTDKKSIIRYKIINLLKNKGLKVHNPPKHYNTWFWICLTILWLDSWFEKILPWFRIYFMSWLKFFSYLINYSKILVLEAWIDTKHEHKKFLRLVSPDIIVITALSAQMWLDEKHIDIVEHEFIGFIKHINKKSKRIDNLSSEYKKIDDVVDLLIEKNWFWIINKEFDRLVEIWNKLVNKVFVRM